MADLFQARRANGAPLQHPLHPPHLKCKPENIPAFLRANARWAPFALVPKRDKPGKYDKVPKRADNVKWGLTTATPELWHSFAQALGAYLNHPGVVHGVGYCLTGPHGVVGVDLDNCSDIKGTPEPWAAEILRHALSLGHYCERSIGGRGFRVLYAGETPSDWVNNARGLEVYGGHAPRFVTVTGHVLREVP